MATYRYGSVQLANGDGTTESGNVLVGSTGGTRVREIRVVSGPTTAPGFGVLVLLVYDGTNSRVVKTLTLDNTANSEQGVFTFSNLILPSTTHAIRARMRSAIASGGTVDITVFGVDL